MTLNIQAARALRALPAMVILLQLPASLRGQGPCPVPAVSALDSGWVAYRSDSNRVAAARFDRAQTLCPHNLDAKVGLGFSLLRLGRIDRADSLFRVVLARSTTNSDAWEGRARTALRMGDTASALAAGRRAVALAPDDQEFRSFLNRVAPDWDRAAMPLRPRPAVLQLVARTRDGSFEIKTKTGWRPFYVKGVNFGVARPGRYPSEFPEDSALYAGWLDTVSSMHANTVRLYTILPPEFYRSLRGWNLSHPDRTLWVVHGVWTELPPRHDFADPDWEAGFQREMRNVVDVIHGGTTIPPRPGHAGGRFDADVSPWVLGYIIGREWEPFAVKAFDAHRGSGGYSGRYLRVEQGPAMDLWLARQCDAMLTYEVEAYNALRPIAYTNWPTLDPLSHPTEATTAEEAYWRKRSGRRSESQKLEYENDAVSLDANLVEPTAANPAGWFASYHAYPYYPDFMLLDPGYAQSRSSEGRSTYIGYLRALVEHHRSIPTLIAEYGVPSSRGVAHLHPEGWGHGGHDEQEMAAIDARLTREIRESGAAGSIVFAWLDEWFKKNWVVVDYEIPRDNTRLWHNVMDAEQNYGILGQYAGEVATTPILGGDPGRWRGLPVLESGTSDTTAALRRVRAGSDESFVYLAVELTPGKFPWSSRAIQLAIDTYLPEVGQHQLPRSGVHSEVGFEFLIDLAGPERGTMAVTPDYQRHDFRLDPATGDDFGHFSRRPVVTRDRKDGRFESLLVTTNRARFGRDGTFFAARGSDRGRLRYGTEAGSTLADWYLDEKWGLLQIRIPWDLLNVTDPSTRTLLFDQRTTGQYGTVTAGDFHVGVVIYSTAGTEPAVVGALPEVVKGMWREDDFAGWRWRGWREPHWHERLKPVYDSLRMLWREVPSEAPGRSVRPAPSD